MDEAVAYNKQTHGVSGHGLGPPHLYVMGATVDPLREQMVEKAKTEVAAQPLAQKLGTMTTFLETASMEEKNRFCPFFKLTKCYKKRGNAEASNHLRLWSFERRAGCEATLDQSPDFVFAHRVQGGPPTSRWTGTRTAGVVGAVPCLSGAADASSSLEANISSVAVSASFGKSSNQQDNLTQSVQVGTAFRTTSLDNRGRNLRDQIITNISKYLAYHERQGHIEHSIMHKFLTGKSKK